MLCCSAAGCQRICANGEPVAASGGRPLRFALIKVRSRETHVGARPIWMAARTCRGTQLREAKRLEFGKPFEKKPCLGCQET